MSFGFIALVRVVCVMYDKDSFFCNVQSRKANKSTGAIRYIYANVRL